MGLQASTSYSRACACKKILSLSGVIATSVQRKTLCFTLSHTSNVLYNDYTPVLLYIIMTSCECLSVPLSIRPVLPCLQSGARNRPPSVLILTERHTPLDLIGFMQSST